MTFVGIAPTASRGRAAAARAVPVVLGVPFPVYGGGLVCPVQASGGVTIGRLWRDAHGWHAAPLDGFDDGARYRSTAVALAACGWREGFTAASLLVADNGGAGVRLAAGGYVATVKRAEFDQFSPYNGGVALVRVSATVTDPAGRPHAHGGAWGVGYHLPQLSALGGAYGATKTSFGARAAAYDLVFRADHVLTVAPAAG